MIESSTTTIQDQKFQEFLHAFRAYKIHKREWQTKMREKLAKEEEAIRRRREELYTEYE